MNSEPWIVAGPEDRSALLVDVRTSDDEELLTMLVAGDLDAVSSAGLQKAVVEVLRRHRPRGIEVDLRGVAFLDSAGIRALVLCHADAEQLGCRLTVAGPRPDVRRVLDLTGLREHFGLA